MNESKIEGDVMGDVIRAVRELIERHYPNAAYAAVVVHLGDGIPPVVITVRGMLVLSNLPGESHATD